MWPLAPRSSLCSLHCMEQTWRLLVPGLLHCSLQNAGLIYPGIWGCLIYLCVFLLSFQHCCQLPQASIWQAGASIASVFSQVFQGGSCLRRWTTVWWTKFWLPDCSSCFKKAVLSNSCVHKRNIKTLVRVGGRGWGRGRTYCLPRNRETKCLQSSGVRLDLMPCVRQHIQTLRSSRWAVQSSHRAEQYLTLTTEFFTRSE